MSVVHEWSQNNQREDPYKMFNIKFVKSDSNIAQFVEISAREIGSRDRLERLAREIGLRDRLERSAPEIGSREELKRNLS